MQIPLGRYTASVLEIFYEQTEDGLNLFIEVSPVDGSATNPDLLELQLADVEFADLSVLIAGGVTILTSEAAAAA